MTTKNPTQDATTASDTTKARKDALDKLSAAHAEVQRLRATIETTSEEIAARLTDDPGADVSAQREARRQARENLEDLERAVPMLDTEFRRANYSSRIAELPNVKAEARAALDRFFQSVRASMDVFAAYQQASGVYERDRHAADNAASALHEIDRSAPRRTEYRRGDHAADLDAWQSDACRMFAKLSTYTFD